MSSQVAEPGPGRIFSNSIKLMLERQKFTLYQHEMLLQRAKITLYQQDMLLGRQKSTLDQHAAREAKTHTLPAGYAGREGKSYTLLAPCCSRHKVLKLLRLQSKARKQCSIYNNLQIMQFLSLANACNEDITKLFTNVSSFYEFSDDSSV